MKSTFRAEVKKFNTSGKKRVIELEVVGKMSTQAILNTDALTGSIVEVVLDDNQMTIDEVEDQTEQMTIDDTNEEDHEGVEYTVEPDGTVGVEPSDADRVAQEFEAAKQAAEKSEEETETIPQSDANEQLEPF
ncbi:hypothetical protein POF51_22240 [Brevibacillus sp. AG]|uniref:hypothetical protein n=1 Tax=Brevibacillus sp. AG TaxID=3020891 RepID=UPI00232C1C8A|nr:hypothetical protein [Brevibacillus sp. AG]MDC0763448.1 hypothetical protein [Brevibacillus sp. AG]